MLLVAGFLVPGAGSHGHPDLSRMPHTAHRTPHTARRTPHTSHPYLTLKHESCRTGKPDIGYLAIAYPEFDFEVASSCMYIH